MLERHCAAWVLHLHTRTPHTLHRLLHTRTPHTLHRLLHTYPPHPAPSTHVSFPPCTICFTRSPHTLHHRLCPKPETSNRLVFPRGREALVLFCTVTGVIIGSSFALRRSTFDVCLGERERVGRESPQTCNPHPVSFTLPKGGAPRLIHDQTAPPARLIHKYTTRHPVLCILPFGGGSTCECIPPESETRNPKPKILYSLVCPEPTYLESSAPLPRDSLRGCHCSLAVFVSLYLSLSFFLALSHSHTHAATRNPESCPRCLEGCVSHTAS